MNRCEGERYSYRVVMNDGDGLPWLVLQASNMGDGEYIYATTTAMNDAIRLADEANRAEQVRSELVAA